MEDLSNSWVEVLTKMRHINSTKVSKWVESLSLGKLLLLGNLFLQVFFVIPINLTSLCNNRVRLLLIRSKGCHFKFYSFYNIHGLYINLIHFGDWRMNE